VVITSSVAAIMECAP